MQYSWEESNEGIQDSAPLLCLKESVILNALPSYLYLTFPSSNQDDAVTHMT